MGGRAMDPSGGPNGRIILLFFAADLCQNAHWLEARNRLCEGDRSGESSAGKVVRDSSASGLATRMCNRVAQPRAKATGTCGFGRHFTRWCDCGLERPSLDAGPKILGFLRFCRERGRNGQRFRTTFENLLLDLVNDSPRRRASWWNWFAAFAPRSIRSR